MAQLELVLTMEMCARWKKTGNCTDPIPLICALFLLIFIIATIFAIHGACQFRPCSL